MSDVKAKIKAIAEDAHLVTEGKVQWHPSSPPPRVQSLLPLPMPSSPLSTLQLGETLKKWEKEMCLLAAGGWQLLFIILLPFQHFSPLQQQRKPWRKWRVPVLFVSGIKSISEQFQATRGKMLEEEFLKLETPAEALSLPASTLNPCKICWIWFLPELWMPLSIFLLYCVPCVGSGRKRGPV